VKRVITEEKIDPATIAGSGKGGRVTKGDVIAHLRAEPRAEPTTSYRRPGETASPRRTESGDGRRRRRPIYPQKMSPLRRKIAAQMVMSQQTTATLTTFNECDMSEVMALRKKAQEKFQADHGSSSVSCLSSSKRRSKH
jgi:2-oxoglutarate dehydrogenase E2 component (dihydrolipoamide succinyltransferase)